SGQAGQPFSTHTTESQARAIFAIYALGLIALAAEVLLLYVRAWRLRGALRLNPREQLITRAELSAWCIPVIVGIISLIFSFALPIRHIAWCGWIYFLMFVLFRIHGVWERRRLKALAP